MQFAWRLVLALNQISPTGAATGQTGPTGPPTVETATPSIHALDLIIWGAIAGSVGILVIISHQKWGKLWTDLAFEKRRATTSCYVAEIVLGLIVAFLIDRIGFRELVNGQVSDLDRWLVPIFLFIAPPFVSLSVVLAVGALEESDRAREMEAWATYVLSSRDDLLRVATCHSLTLSERTHRLREVGIKNGQSSCTHIGDALSTEAHTYRLMEAIHHVFELRGRSDPVEHVKPGTTQADPPDKITWRVALFEEQGTTLRLVRIWDGHRDNCSFTDESMRNAVFKTDRKQPGIFAVACLDEPQPIIVSDTGKSGKDMTAVFRPILEDQSKRIRSIAGFSLTTKPRRVLVLDANREGFFNSSADKPLLRQLQIILQMEFEFEQALTAVVLAAIKGCPGRSDNQASGSHRAAKPRISEGGSAT